MGLLERWDRHNHRVVDFQNAAGQGRVRFREPSRVVAAVGVSLSVLAALGFRLLRKDVITGTAATVVQIFGVVVLVVVFGGLVRWRAQARRAWEADQPEVDRPSDP